MENSMNGKVVLPVITAFGISVLLCPVMIPFLKRLKFGQFVRNDGPKAHLKKAGTPTMGGIVILLSVTATALMYVPQTGEVLPILFVTLAFGLLGFLDDYIKIVMKRSKGLSAWQKLLGEVLVTAVFAGYVCGPAGPGTEILIPFSGGRYLDLGGWYPPFLFAAVLGTVNGANFTDGLDGLASGVTVLIAAFFSAAAIGTGSGVFPITCAVMGALFGFLVYNTYPARVFMGDTGSLALGGFAAAAAVMMRMPLFILLAGAVYLAEVLSVILQIAYFKLSGGKRLLKMAPLHHHFELCGWPETRVTAVFSIVTAALCIIGLLAV